MEALNEKCGFCFLVEKKAFTRGNGVAEAEPVGAEVFWLETEMKFSCRLRPFSLQDLVQQLMKNWGKFNLTKKCVMYPSFKSMGCGAADQWRITFYRKSWSRCQITFWPGADQIIGSAPHACAAAANLPDRACCWYLIWSGWVGPESPRPPPPRQTHSGSHPDSPAHQLRRLKLSISRANSTQKQIPYRILKS